MLLSILRLGYALCDLISIGAGTIVLFGLLTGELLDKWTVLFLRCTLATSVTGLLFPLHGFTFVQRCSMLTVYVSGIAILAWRKFHLSGVWCSMFALTITVVLYLNVAVAIHQAFAQISRFTEFTPVQPELISQPLQLLVIFVFAVIGIVAVKRFKDKRTRSVHPDKIRSAHS
jgi:hypothetical protein